MVRLPAPGVVIRQAGSGSPWERLACGILDKSGIRLDRFDYRPDTWSLVYVLRGRGSFCIPPGQPRPLAAGDCFVRRPGMVHSTVLDPGSGWCEAFIGIGPHLSTALHAAGWLCAGPPAWTWGLQADRVRRFTQLRSALRMVADNGLPAVAAIAFSLMIEALASAPAEPSVDILDRASVLLDGDVPLAPAQVATRVGIGYESFRRRFRERFGQSPAAWGRERRIDRACSLLTGTALSIATIALRLGYANPNAFTNRFTAVLGTNPSRYRQQGGGR